MAKATRQKLLQSAQDLFLSNGYHASSLDQISNDAGQSKGALFHYFKNKKEVGLSVLEHYTQVEALEPMAASFAVNADTKDALKSFVEALYSAFKDSGFEGGCLLGNMALELADVDEEVRQELAMLFLDRENQLVGYLEDESRGADVVMEPRQFARLFIAALQGVTMSCKVHKDEARAEQEFKTLHELIEGFIV